MSSTIKHTCDRCGYSEDAGADHAPYPPLGWAMVNVQVMMALGDISPMKKLPPGVGPMRKDFCPTCAATISKELEKKVERLKAI